jgi:hypothetical protein
VLKIGEGMVRELVVFRAVPDDQRKIPDEVPHYFA